MPNKLFEYIAAGIPVIVNRAGEVAEWVFEPNVGVVVEKFKEIRSQYNEHKKLLRNVVNIREQFVMENQVKAIVDIYSLAMKRREVVHNVLESTISLK